MRYENVVRRLKNLGCEIITEEELIKRLKEEGDVTYFGPYGCLHCGKAWGKKDFEEIRYAIIPEPLFEDQSPLDEIETIGICFSSSLIYADIGKCRFCGHSDLFSEVYAVE